MSGWSDFTSFAKSTLTNAQKQIDKALDIKDVPVGADGTGPSKLQDEFFAAFGLTKPSDIPSDAPPSMVEPPTESSTTDSAPSTALLTIFSSAPAVSDLASKLKLNTWFSPGSSVHEPELLAVSTAPASSEDLSFPLEGEEASFVQEGWKSVELSASSLNVLGSQESSFFSVEESGSGLLTPVATVGSTSGDFFLSPIDASVAELVVPPSPVEARVTLQLIVPQSTDDDENKEVCSSPNRHSPIDLDCPKHEEDLPPSVSPSPPKPASLGSPASSTGEGCELIAAGATACTSPSIDGPGNVSSSDIEILGPETPNGSERSSVRSGFVWTPASSVGGVPLKRHLANVEQALAAASVARVKKHRRVSSDQAVGPVEPEAASAFKLSAKEIAKSHELEQTLNAREETVLRLSKENALLAEENHTFKNMLARVTPAETGKDATAEKLLAVIDERDGLRRKCESLQKEVATRVNIQQLQVLLQERDEQIRQLTNEGERLSKREFQQGGIIKKLREKEKEADKMVEAQKGKLKELDEVRETLKQKLTQEQQYEQLIAEFQMSMEQANKKVGKLQSELEDSVEKNGGYKATLEKCYRELAEANKEKIAKEAELEDMKHEHASAKSEDLRHTVEKLTKEKEAERQQLLQQIEELRLTVVRTTHEQNRKEDALRWENARLQKKLQEAELRNEELSEAATAATKPLLRQIESLQSSFKSQQTNWERMETSLYDRLTDAESKTVTALQAEKVAVAEVSESRTRLRQLESQLNTLSVERSKLDAEGATLRKEKASLDDTIKRLSRELDGERQRNGRALEELRKEKELMATQFDFEKAQMKSEQSLKMKDLVLALDEKDKLLSTARHELADRQHSRAPTTPEILSRPSPTFTSNDQDILSPQLSDDVSGGYSALLEKLRARLQQREGEVAALREELRRMQARSDVLTTQVGDGAAERAALETKVAELAAVGEQTKELNASYQALLQLYGEKVEQNEELRLDLDDVKSMYRQQIEDLLVQINRLKCTDS